MYNTWFVHVLVAIVFVTFCSSVLGYVYEEPEISEQCKKQGFCEDVANYPTEYVESLVASLGDKVKDWPKESLDDEDPETSRVEDSSKDQTLDICNSSPQVLLLQTAQDKENEWFIILNLKNRPLQAYLTEMCNNSESDCNSIASFQDGYKGSCLQKYVYKNFHAMDKSGNYVKKSLKLPSCCSCAITVLPA